MKTILMLYFLLAGFALGQFLPYQYAYKNERGWKEMMVFEQSPNDPNVILVSLYSYVDAQVPYYKLKETKPAGDTKKALAFIAQHQAAEAQEAQNRANRPVAQAPVWKMFVKNKEFQERYADEIAAEVEIVNGREAAAQFRQKVEADRAAKAASAKDKEKISPSSMYHRSGDRITINGNLATGYNVRGDQLVDHATAKPTHMRTGAYWVPLNDSHPTIYDP